MKTNTFFLVSILIMSGCASSNTISSTEANSDNNLKEFVNNKLGKKSSMVSDFNANINQDGVIEYTAIFNGSNNRSLKRPKDSIESYYIQKSGTFTLLDDFSNLKQRHTTLFSDISGISYKPIVIQAAKEGYFGSST